MDMQAKNENFTVVSTSALDSLKRMVEELQADKDKMLNALKVARSGFVDLLNGKQKYLYTQICIEYYLGGIDDAIKSAMKND